MKIIDVPQTGKLGLTVTYPSRTGLIRRSWVVPANPQTAEQIAQRGYLAATASAYDALTEAQQDAWVAAAALEQSRPTLGQSGPLTGLQLYVKINANLRKLGETPVTAPPAKVTQVAPPITGLTITNTAGVIALKLAASGDLEVLTIVSASAPQNSGTRRAISYNWLGSCPAVTGGFCDITSLYTAKYGVPAVADRIFATVRTYVDGWPGAAVSVSALVPASS